MRQRMCACVHQIVKCAGLWQGGEVILFRPCLVRWPFNEQPLLRMELGFSPTHPKCRRASRQAFIATLAPTDVLEGTLRQAFREGLYTDRLAGMPWHHWRPPRATVRLRRQGLLSGGQTTTALVIPTPLVRH